jgi:hypothetical protein
VQWAGVPTLRSSGIDVEGSASDPRRDSQCGRSTVAGFKCRCNRSSLATAGETIVKRVELHQIQKSDKEVLQDIESGAKDVRTAGTELAERIKQFEAWLNKVPGRVRAKCEIGSDGDGNHTTYLCFAKDGKGWSLFRYVWYNERDEGSDWTPLRDATLDEKLVAVAAFPRLLRAMSEAQREMVGRLRETTTEYDQFAAGLGIKGGA